jgi:hypothetical protein
MTSLYCGCNLLKDWEDAEGREQFLGFLWRSCGANQQILRRGFENLKQFQQPLKQFEATQGCFSE